jgi:hypothetical protein
MPRALWGSQVCGRFFMIEVPLYGERSTPGVRCQLGERLAIFYLHTSSSLSSLFLSSLQFSDTHSRRALNTSPFQNRYTSSRTTDGARTATRAWRTMEQHTGDRLGEHAKAPCERKTGADVRQTRLDYGVGLQVKLLKTLFPLHMAASGGWGGLRTRECGTCTQPPPHLGFRVKAL